MLTPAEIARLPRPVVKLYTQAMNDILVDMARRIGKVDYLTGTAEWQSIKLKEMGMTYKEIVSALSRLSKKTQKDIIALFRDSSIKSLGRDDKIFSQGVELTKYSPQLLLTLTKRTKDALKYNTNLTKSTAANMSNTLGKALDRAYLQVSSGGFSIDSAKKQAVNTLLDEGVSYVEYKSGRTLSVESAVSTNLTTSLKQTTLDLSLQRGEDLGWRYYQVSSHAGCAPDHYWMQGRVFEIDTPEYEQALEDLQRPNCRHSMSPFLDGISQSSFDVDQTASENQDQYEAEQKALYNERMADKWKTKADAMKEAGLDNSREMAKYREWNNKS